MTIDAIKIRNFDLMKKIFDDLDVLSTYYKLSQRDISVIHILLTKHTTYNAYIVVKTKDFNESRRVVYRAIDKLENENIITVMDRPHNQHEGMKIYFTVSFIKRVCGEDFGDRYEKWLDWQKSYKNEKGDE